MAEKEEMLRVTCCYAIFYELMLMYALLGIGWQKRHNTRNT